MFSLGRTGAREASLVRQHLEGCEDCRATLAGLSIPDEPQHTIANEHVIPQSQVEHSQGPGAIQNTVCLDVAERPLRSNSAPMDGEIPNTICFEDASPPRCGAAPQGEDAIQTTTILESLAQTRGVIPPDDGSAPHGLRADSAAEPTIQMSMFTGAPPESARGPTTDPILTREIQSGVASDSAQLGFVDSEDLYTRAEYQEPSLPLRSALENVNVPGYDILEELGRGGMGVVYKARHHGLQRMVALKMVLAGVHVGPVGLARFRAEAEAAAKLSHPNIVQIYETGECDGLPFFSLELVDGGNLDQKMRDSPTTPRAAAQITETLARTIAVAHERGIIHRDLKPANILLAKVSSQSTTLRSRDFDSHASLPSDHWSRNTVPKITDFGLAKQFEDDSSQTRTGTILGTPSYMPPEQASGKNRQLGPPADIYSLGAILYELLVGRPPFRAGNPFDTIRQVIEQEPVPPRQLEPRVPLDLETICLKCLEKQPVRRYASALALADDLSRFIEGHPILARPTPLWERAWKWGRRRKAVVALLAVSTMAVVSMVLMVVWHNVSLRSKLDVAITEERRAREREQGALEERRLTLLEQEGQKLYDSARVAVAAKDWSTARLDLEKALTTIGSEARLKSLREPAEVLLKEVQQELRAEAERRASRGRFQSFASLRDEAQFLGTLYTGMDLAANLQAARAAVQKALAVYGVRGAEDARPEFDGYLDDAQKAELLADCSQLLLILAETDAQSATGQKPVEKEQHLRKALTELEQARRLGAPSRVYHLRRARYLNLLGDAAEAARAEESARETAVVGVADYFLVGDELYRRERFDEASKAFDQVLERKPNHFWAQYLNALCLLRQQRPAEARALLGACLAQRSDFAWVYLLRGFAQEELQAWAAADSDFQKAAHMPLDDNSRYVLLVHRGVLRVRTNRMDDAIAELSAAVKLKPKAYQAFVNLAEAYRLLNQRDRALEQLQTAVQLQPGLAHLHRLVALLYLERDEPDLALMSFDRAIERESPSSPYLVDDHIGRGRLLLRIGKNAEALASFDAALALRKDHPQGQRLRAEALFRLDRFAEVVEAFNHYLETGTPLELVYRGRGLARAELGQYAGAIEDFTKALELHPTSAVQAHRGWTYLVVDAPKLAMRDFELAIELDPKNGDAYAGRGFARAQLGLHREALRDAADALGQGPPSPRLLYNIARIYAQCPGPYANRALELIQQALNLLPAEQRRGFWLTHVQKDAALAALRHHRSFIKLESQLSARQ
jgi:eukaryotic-like serine/threonine-protein kinase